MFDKFKFNNIAKLVVIKKQLENTPLNNGDLLVKPEGLFKTSLEVFYKKQSLGVLNAKSGASDIRSLIKAAQRFCPELHPVNVSEYYQIKTSAITSYLGQVTEIYTNNDKKLTYVVKDLFTGKLEFYTHFEMVDISTRIYKVG